MKPQVVPGTWRLFAPALIVWAVAAWSIGVPGASGLIVTMMLLGIVVLGAVCVHPRVRAKVLPVLQVAGVTAALLLVIAARIDLAEWQRGDQQLTVPFVTLQVNLAGFPNPLEQEGESRYWVLGDAQVDRGSVPVVMWGDGEAPRQWAPGTQITASGPLRAQTPADSSAYSLTLHSAEQPTPSGYERAITTLRNGLHDASANIQGAELVPGFAVGDSSLVDDHLDAAMKASSLTHLIAVSGANCALIVGAVMWMLSWLGVGIRGRIMAAGVVLGAFVLLIGPDASIQRAALMAAVTLISRFGGRRAVAFPSLGIAMIVLLIADPWQSRHPGFTLSVAATAGILLWVPAIDSWMHQRLRVPKVVSLPFAVTVAAQCACGPLLLLLQPGLPVGGLLANMLVGPAAPFGTGVGLIAMLTIPMHEAMGHAVTVLASLPARWVAGVAFFTEQLPFSRWHWPGGATGAILLTVMQAALMVAIMLRRSHQRTPWKDWELAPKPTRYAMWMLSSLGVGLLVAISVTTPVVERAVTPKDWMIVACDVGQGDALLIRDPAQPDLVMLTDTGEDPALLRECLTRFGVKEIALLVLTHDDQDHVGALSEVLDGTRAAIISRPVDGENESRTTVAKLEDANVPYLVGESGMHGTLGEGSRVSWNIIAPTSTQPISGSNQASIVMVVTVNNTRMLMLGDTGGAEHEALLAKQVDLSADIVKVAHHGSRDQDPQLLEAARARYGLISSGADNRYGHPSDDVLSDLGNAGTVPLRTDEHGSIAISRGQCQPYGVGFTQCAHHTLDAEQMNEW